MRCFGSETLSPGKPGFQRLRFGDTFEETRQRILNVSMDAVFGRDSIKAGEQMKGPGSLHHRYMTEDVPYGLVLMASLGDLLRVPTPTMTSIIHLCSVISGVNYVAEGRGAKQLGLDGMSGETLIRFLQQGRLES